MPILDASINCSLELEPNRYSFLIGLARIGAASRGSVAVDSIGIAEFDSKCTLFYAPARSAGA